MEPFEVSETGISSACIWAHYNLQSVVFIELEALSNIIWIATFLFIQ